MHSNSPCWTWRLAVAPPHNAAMAESIYNLIPQPVPPVIQPPRYLSKHGGDKPPTFSTFGLTGTSKPGFSNIAGAEAEPASGHHAFKKPHATMGREGNAKPPSEMLKKGTGGGGGAADANANTSTCALWPARPGRLRLRLRLPDCSAALLPTTARCSSLCMPGVAAPFWASETLTAGPRPPPLAPPECEVRHAHVRSCLQVLGHKASRRSEQRGAPAAFADAQAERGRAEKLHHVQRCGEHSCCPEARGALSLQRARCTGQRRIDSRAHFPVRLCAT
jgi:hypothetical protein